MRESNIAFSILAPAYAVGEVFPTRYGIERRLFSSIGQMSSPANRPAVR
jgi:hypothetical protein